MSTHTPPPPGPSQRERSSPTYLRILKDPPQIHLCSSNADLSISQSITEVRHTLTLKKTKSQPIEGGHYKTDEAYSSATRKGSNPLQKMMTNRLLDSSVTGKPLTRKADSKGADGAKRRLKADSKGADGAKRPRGTQQPPMVLQLGTVVNILSNPAKGRLILFLVLAIFAVRKL
ncbi:hypothetical protein BDR26DRAFT_1012209 [Obelidium mucronatum]|nr:hypothetical protein BDR26DRAFT_1012209 [Obelidium mucronatum]